MSQAKLYQDAEAFINDMFFQETHDKRGVLVIRDLLAEKLRDDDKIKDVAYYGQREGVVHSSALSGCLRGVMHDMFGTEPDQQDEKDEDRKLGVFKAGNLFEDFIVETLGDRCIHKQREYTYKYKNITLVGRSDYTIDDSGIMRVGENKSVHSQSFWHREREGTLVAWQNQIQIQIYMWLERELFGNEWEGIFSYISKDDCTVISVPVKFNRKFIDQIVLPILDIIDAEYMAKKDTAAKRNELVTQLKALPKDADLSTVTSLHKEIDVLTGLINDMPNVPAPTLAMYSKSKEQYEQNWLCKYCKYHSKCAGSGWPIEAASEVKRLNSGARAGIPVTPKKEKPTITVVG